MGDTKNRGLQYPTEHFIGEWLDFVVLEDRPCDTLPNKYVSGNHLKGIYKSGVISKLSLWHYLKMP